jgi:ACT domain-containing protein
MAQKKHKPEEIVAKRRQVDVLVSQGRPVAEAVRSIGVTRLTYYQWRKEFGGLKTHLVERLKDMENDRAVEAPLMEWMAPAPGIAMCHIGCCHTYP